MLYLIDLPEAFGQLSLYYPVYYDSSIPVLLLSKNDDATDTADVLTPSGVITIKLEYLTPCPQKI